MALQLGDPCPDFSADSSKGEIHFHDYIDGKWAILYSHPADFTPICTTELAMTERLVQQFAALNTTVIALSSNQVAEHKIWIADIKQAEGEEISFPIIADNHLEIARLFGMVHPLFSDKSTIRSLFIIDPKKKIRLTITYPASVGRNFNEILRVLKSLQRTDEYQVFTPANWVPGEDVVIDHNLSEETVKEKFGDKVREVIPYLRYTPDPIKED